MKKSLLYIFLAAFAASASAQTNPAITSWLINTDGTLGRHYMVNNSTPIQDDDSVNVQSVYYSAEWVYVKTNGIPSYVTGPFQDGNPSLASDQDAIFKIPLNPTENLNNSTNTTPGNIGVFINGVALFDYRDGVSWNNNTQAEGGGPIMGPPGQGIWNRDAIVAERAGFDCAKGHPAMGNYHHHQNPSAFDLDITPISDVCNLYDADGLYIIDDSQHSPLIGFAFDGFPIYGAYGFLNTDGTGAPTRMKSSFQLRDITARTHYADGSDVTDGPPINDEYPLGHCREDYEFVAHTEPDYLDIHNGRFCVTPEYPEGIYAYFCTVDEEWNSAYPYVVGPTFFGTKVASNPDAIQEPVTQYNATTNAVADSKIEKYSIGIFPNPAADFIAIQIGSLVENDVIVRLFDIEGKLIKTSRIMKGSTATYLDTQTMYDGTYLLEFTIGQQKVTKKVVVTK